MPTARKFLRHRRRQARNHRQPLPMMVGALLIVFICAIFAITITGAGGALAFSQLQPDFPPADQLADQFLTQRSDEVSKIVAQNRGGGWETIATIRDPLTGPYRWRPAVEFPPEAAAAIRVLAPDFAAEQLFSQVDSPFVLNIPALDQFLQDNYRAQLEQQYTVEDQDEWFLNTAYFGHLAFGLEAAAEQYFQKPVEELTLAELALLIPIPLDSAINPIDNFAGAKAQQELVLERLVEQGIIDRQTFVTARFSAVTLNAIQPTGPNAEFVTLVRRQAELLLTPQQLVWGGVTIYTPLDLNLQQQAHCVAKAHLSHLNGGATIGLGSDEVLLCPALAFLPDLSADQTAISQSVGDAAIVLIDPRTGDIRALATTNPAAQLAVSPAHQPGTAFTVFPVVTALSQGLSSGTMLFDVERDFGTPYNGVAYVPQNSDGRFWGPLTLRDALVADRLVPAVELLARVGPENGVRIARQLGLSSLAQDKNRYGLSLVAGGGEVSVLEMAQAYSVLANLGQKTGMSFGGADGLHARSIIAIEDSQNQTIIEIERLNQELVATEIAFVVNDMLADQQNRCAAWGCPSVLDLPGGRPAAVKVGSTNDQRDAWTIGYTPQLVTAVWVGNADQRPMGPVTGSTGAAPIWHAVMSYALQDQPPELWTQPENIVERLICLPSGLLATDICPTRREIFLSGTEPTAVDQIYQEVALNRLNGRLATLDTPAELIQTEVYAVYPSAAAAWVEANQIPQPPAEYDTLKIDVDLDDMVITAPEPFGVVTGVVEIRGTIDLEPGGWYRISYFAGLAPDLFYEIEADRTVPLGRELLGRWDTAALEGLYTVVVSVFRPDGTFAEINLPLTVDQTAPEINVTRPTDPGRIETTASRVTIAAEVSDNLSVATVSFYTDADNDPFAVRDAPPYRADFITENNCQVVVIVARDTAGNESEAAVGPICPGN